ICRLAEALFHVGRQDEAVRCGRHAFADADRRRGVLDFCAWLFSNCGCHREAVAAYRQLLALCPDWTEGHRHLCNALWAAGDEAEAVEAALHAVAAAPRDTAIAIQAAELLMRQGRLDEAAALARRATADGKDAAALRVLSAVEMLRGHLDAALAAVDRAIE